VAGVAAVKVGQDIRYIQAGDYDVRRWPFKCTSILQSKCAGQLMREIVRRELCVEVDDLDTTILSYEIRPVS
jgi:hypothetical protein